MKKKTTLLLTLLFTLTISNSVFSASRAGSLALSAGGEMWKNQKTMGHGIMMADYRKKIGNHGRFHLTFNTDTLMTGFDKDFSSDFHWGFYLKGELNFAGILPDYYQQGELLESGGFKASFIELENHMVLKLNNKNNIYFSLPVKKWYFKAGDKTESTFTLPANFWNLHPRITYNYWALKYDKAFYQSHRFFPRINGLAFNISLGLDWRTDVNKWGFTGSTGARSNHPKDAAIYCNEALNYGIQLSHRLRLQLKQTFFMGNGLDDINRQRLGGMNPYVTPIAGLPWAAIISDRYLSAHPGIFFQLFGESEVSFQLDYVYTQDIKRTGDDSWDSTAGISIYFDLRFGKWQIDLKAGYTLPGDWLIHDKHYSTFVAVGRIF